jgi:hypothetical protein
MKGVESISDAEPDHNPALEIKRRQCGGTNVIDSSHLLPVLQAWSVDDSLSGHRKYMSQLYLQRIATLEQRHILDTDDVQNFEPTSSDDVSQKLATLKGLLEFGSS